jgi:hypothetical protein
VAEGGGLLNRCTVSSRTVSSNLIPSANPLLQNILLSILLWLVGVSGDFCAAVLGGLCHLVCHLWFVSVGGSFLWDGIFGHLRPADRRAPLHWRIAGVAFSDAH